MKQSSLTRRPANLTIGLTIVILLSFALAFVFLPVSLGRLGLGDFRAYWSGARVLIQGGNPYDLAALTAAYFEGKPPASQFDPAWNPPWLLLLLSPLAVLPAEMAARVWLIVNVVILWGVPFVVWRLLVNSGDDRAPVWLGLVGIVFGASLATLALGQMTAWVLAGLLLAIIGLQQRRDGWAGAALLMTFVKPQLVYLAVPVILLWSAQQRRWRIWLGLGGASLLALLIITLLSPNWLMGYWKLAGGYDFLQHSAATIGGFWQAYTGNRLLRFAGVLALFTIPFLLRIIERCDWLMAVNAALLISLPLAPYSWSFDQVLLLPALIQTIFWLYHSTDPRRFVLFAVLIAIYASLWLMMIQGVGDFLYVWVPLAIGGLYALAWFKYGKPQPPSALVGARL